MFRLGVMLVTVVLGGSALAEDMPLVIAIKNHQFVPSDVEIPSGTKVKLVLRNSDDTAAEFESIEFHREKVIEPGKEVVVFVGPLDPGRYEFFDDFHPKTRGHLIVR